MLLVKSTISRVFGEYSSNVTIMEKIIGSRRLAKVMVSVVEYSLT